MIYLILLNINMFLLQIFGNILWKWDVKNRNIIWTDLEKTIFEIVLGWLTVI